MQVSRRYELTRFQRTRTTNAESKTPAKPFMPGMSLRLREMDQVWSWGWSLKLARRLVRWVSRVAGN